MSVVNNLSSLRGLGPKSREILATIGIRTRAQLGRAGPVAVYLKAKRLNKSVSLNFLYGLVGAIEDCDWRDVKRERKLDLLFEIEKHESSFDNSELQLKDLRNIGKAMLKDFELLGIKSVKQLATCDADELYARIQTITASRHDPCVWDTYAAAIHQAKTGEALAWWEFTKIRKERPRLLSTRERWQPKRPRAASATPSRRGRGR